MTQKEPPTPLPEWDLIEDLRLEEELERVGGLTPEQIREEMTAIGVDPGRADRIAERVLAQAGGGAGGGATPAPAPPQAPVGRVASLAEARARRGGVRWYAIAIAAGVALALGALRRDQLASQIDAWLRPPPVPTPAPGPTAPPPFVPPTREETPAEKAAKLREEAYADLKKGYTGDAQDELDEARGLDPAGDSDPRVVQARAEIETTKPAPKKFNAKPGLAPYEKPLKPIKKTFVH